MSISKKGKSPSFVYSGHWLCKHISYYGKSSTYFKTNNFSRNRDLKKIQSGDSINSICVNNKLHKSSVYHIVKQEDSLKKFVRPTERKYQSPISEIPGMPCSNSEENEDLATIGTLVAQAGMEHLCTNSDISNWFQKEYPVESNEEQMELSDMESKDLYDSGHEEYKIKVDKVA